MLNTVSESQYFIQQHLPFVQKQVLLYVEIYKSCY